jgi:hypothetical protein
LVRLTEQEFEELLKQVEEKEAARLVPNIEPIVIEEAPPEETPPVLPFENLEDLEALLNSDVCIDMNVLEGHTF